MRHAARSGRWEKGGAGKTMPPPPPPGRKSKGGRGLSPPPPSFLPPKNNPTPAQRPTGRPAAACRRRRLHLRRQGPLSILPSRSGPPNKEGPNTRDAGSRCLFLPRLPTKKPTRPTSSTPCYGHRHPSHRHRCRCCRRPLMDAQSSRGPGRPELSADPSSLEEEGAVAEILLAFSVWSPRLYLDQRLYTGWARAGPLPHGRRVGSIVISCGSTPPQFSSKFVDEGGLMCVRFLWASACMHG